MKEIDILIIGSANIDQVVTVKKHPELGQTVVGESYNILCGGKGANQAIASARLSAKTMFIGCVGDDSNGKLILENFKVNNVDTERIIVSKRESTGVALITVSNSDNSIIIVHGANYENNIENIKANIDIIKNSKMVLLQNEIPSETVKYIIDICYINNVNVILNPAPAREITEEIINKVSFLTPNENEIIDMFKGKYTIEEILKMYPNKVIVTLGGDGAKFFNGSEIIHVKAPKVKVIDTTGAGDTFNAAFAYSIINEKSITESVEFAIKVASIKVQRKGAQLGMPFLREIL